MKTALIASLENVLQSWLEDQAENNALSTEVYWPDNLNIHMARAAAAAFDASVDGQIFAHEQEPSK